MRDAIIAAAGALLVAVLNELRATLRARQADRDRKEALARARADRFFDAMSDEPCGPDCPVCGDQQRGED